MESDKKVEVDLISEDSRDLDLPKISRSLKTSSELADYLGSGGSVSEIHESIPVIDSAQNDMKAYLSLYARSQLKRIEKLTNYLDVLEDKMMENVDSYDPYNFLQAMKNLQNSLASAIDLVKLIGTDDKYLSIIYNENNTQINNIQMGVPVDFKLSRESRDKLRNIISKMNVISSNTKGE